MDDDCAIFLTVISTCIGDSTEGVNTLPAVVREDEAAEDETSLAEEVEGTSGVEGAETELIESVELIELRLFSSSSSLSLSRRDTVRRGAGVSRILSVTTVELS